MKKKFSSNSDPKKDEKRENLKSPIIMLIIASITRNDSNSFEETYIKQFCNSCIKNKYTKIVKYKKLFQ